MHIKGQLIPESCTMAILNILPCVNCVKPKEALSHMARSTPGGESVYT